MTHAHPSIPPFPSLRASLVLTLGTILPLLLAVVVLLVIGRTDQIAPAAWTWAACTAAAVIALEPIRWASHCGLDRVAMATLAAFVLRLTLAAAAIIVIVLALNLPPINIVLWAVPWYLILLAIEVKLIYRYFTDCAAYSAPAAAVSSACAGGCE